MSDPRIKRPEWLAGIEPLPSVMLDPKDVWDVMVKEGKVPSTKWEFLEAFSLASDVLGEAAGPIQDHVKFAVNETIPGSRVRT